MMTQMLTDIENDGLAGLGVGSLLGAWRSVSIVPCIGR